MKEKSNTTFAFQLKDDHKKSHVYMNKVFQIHKKSVLKAICFLRSDMCITVNDFHVFN